MPERIRPIKRQKSKVLAFAGARISSRTGRPYAVFHFEGILGVPVIHNVLLDTEQGIVHFNNFIRFWVEETPLEVIFRRITPQIGVAYVIVAWYKDLSEEPKNA